MVAGPNGSGKSTLLNHLSKNFSFPLGYCLNPDEIERELKLFGRLYLGGWGARVEEEALRSFVRSHGLSAQLTADLPAVRENVIVAGPNFQPGYFTAILCDFLRRQWLAAFESFTFETVMSHEDKIGLLRQARKAHYRTYLYYICTDSTVINRERIANRVAEGGHDVPIDKIESRFERSLALLCEAIRHTDRAYLFDNSTKSHRLIAEFESAKLIRVSENLPAWFITSVFNNLPLVDR
jgi:predicted ABC-type ATPase